MRILFAEVRTLSTCEEETAKRIPGVRKKKTTNRF
jgi:hypothetical protein